MATISVPKWRDRLFSEDLQENFVAINDSMSSTQCLVTPTKELNIYLIKFASIDILVQRTKVNNVVYLKTEALVTALEVLKLIIYASRTLGCTHIRMPDPIKLLSMV